MYFFIGGFVATYIIRERLSISPVGNTGRSGSVSISPVGTTGRSVTSFRIRYVQNTQIIIEHSVLHYRLNEV